LNNRFVNRWANYYICLGSHRIIYFFLFVYFSSPKATSSINRNGRMLLQVLIPHPLSSPPVVQDACESFNQPALSCTPTERVECCKKKYQAPLMQSGPNPRIIVVIGEGGRPFPRFSATNTKHEKLLCTHTLYRYPYS